MSQVCMDALGSAEWPEESDTRVAPAGAGLWHVLQTRSRAEKALAESLQARGIRHFLPLMSVKRMYGNRRAIVDLPLFPGYVFLKGSLEDVYTADRTRFVARVIRVYDQQKLAEELRSVELALQGATAPFDPYPYLRHGIRVEVTAGPLRGVRGVIESRHKPDRLILQVDLLGRATSLEMDSSLLMPLGED